MHAVPGQSASPALAVATAAALVLSLGLTLAVTALLRRSRRLARHAARLAQHRQAVARLRREERLNTQSEAEAYWQQIRSATAPILVTTPAGAIVAASPAVVEMFGFSSEEELRRFPITDRYADTSDRVEHLIGALREHGRVRSGEFRMKRRDNTELHVLTNVRPIEVGDGSRCYEGVLTDITELREAVEERRRLEAQLHLSRKLELIGQLASGIAHEINTPMQYIWDNMVFLKGAFDQLLALKEAPSRAAPATAARDPAELSGLSHLRQEVADAFAGTLEGIERVTETVQAMKEFAHPGDLEITSTDLNQAIRTTLIVARSEYKHAAKVHTELGDIQPVDCRRAEINKVLLNLIVNAAHAIEAAGRSGKGVITIVSRSDGDSVRIEVTDNGCGIPPAVLPRIFDPFFTTKSVGKGSGQGLAIARSIIAGHGGELTVSSTVGAGTTFTIRLPSLANAKLMPARTTANRVNAETLIG